LRSPNLGYGCNVSCQARFHVEGLLRLRCIGTPRPEDDHHLPRQPVRLPEGRGTRHRQDEGVRLRQLRRRTVIVIRDSDSSTETACYPQECSYFGARWYDPQLGMWTSPDPKHQYASPYAFSTGPMNGSDPDGSCYTSDVDDCPIDQWQGSSPATSGGTFGIEGGIPGNGTDDAAATQVASPGDASGDQQIDLGQGTLSGTGDATFSLTDQADPFSQNNMGDQSWMTWAPDQSTNGNSGGDGISNTGSNTEVANPGPSPTDETWGLSQVRSGDDNGTLFMAIGGGALVKSAFSLAGTAWEGASAIASAFSVGSSEPIVTSMEENLSDEAFVHITTPESAEWIALEGFKPELSGYVTKWKYVKNVGDPSTFNTRLYRQDLWPLRAGKFDQGASVLQIEGSQTFFSPRTNWVNGVPQWRFDNFVPPAGINLIKRIY